MPVSYMDGVRALVQTVSLEIEHREGKDCLIIRRHPGDTPMIELDAWDLIRVRLESSQSFQDEVIHLHYRPGPGKLLSGGESDFSPGLRDHLTRRPLALIQ